jgi:DNA primase
MACHLAGITTAVATCGTAFGDDHIRRINQLFGSSDAPAQVVFTFDPDAAGQKAAMRAFESSGKFIASTFVAVGPEGLDPCDLRISRGDAAVLKMIDTKRPIYEFALDQKIAGHDLSSYPGRLSAATAAVSVLTKISDLGAREEYVRILAGKVQLGSDEINRLLSAEVAKLRSSAVAGARRGMDIDPGEPPLPEDAPEFPTPNLNDPNTRLEQEVLAVILQAPAALTEDGVLLICQQMFATPAYVVIADAASQSISSLKQPDWFAQIVSKTPEVLHNLLRHLAAKELPIRDAEQLSEYALSVVNSARKKIMMRQKSALVAALGSLDVEAQPEEHNRIQQALVVLEGQIRAIE